MALLTFEVRSTSTPSYLHRLPNPGSKIRPQPAIDHYRTLCQPFTTTAFAKRAFRCSALAVRNTLPQTVINSDSVAVFTARRYASAVRYMLWPRVRLPVCVCVCLSQVGVRPSYSSGRPRLRRRRTARPEQSAGRDPSQVIAGRLQTLSENLLLYPVFY